MKASKPVEFITISDSTTTNDSWYRTPKERIASLALVLSMAAIVINCMPGCSNYSPEPLMPELPPIINVDSNEEGEDIHDATEDFGGVEDDANTYDDGLDSESELDDIISDAIPGDTIADAAADSEYTETAPDDHCPGGRHCECDGPSDCYSGLCAPFTDHNRCTGICSDDVTCGDDMICGPFSISGPDTLYACLQRWPTACRPCVDDTQCEVQWLSGDRQPRCLQAGDNGNFCAPVCDDDSDCPDQYTCVRENRQSGDTGLCYPEGGECPCNDYWQHSGYETTCEITNEFGTCSATRLCNEICPAAIPAPETCDGIDNNCNGQIDEGLNDVPCDLTNEWGVCGGKSACINGSMVCLGEFPRKDTCNGMDDDCDGKSDEDLGTTVCGFGICKKIVENCINGRNIYCDPLAGSREETCNGLDDDCDGETDEDLGRVSCGIGDCHKSVPACAAGRPNMCVPGLPALSERCDGRDNNCDGRTDEGIAALTCGVGICKHSVAGCVDGRTNQCNPYQGMTAESCNGLDDDCDGELDDNLSSAVDQYEPNPNCGFPQDMGPVHEGETAMVIKASPYPGSDNDWFKITATEKDHSCVWGTDQDYVLTVYLFEPVGPSAEQEMNLELWSDSCQMLGSSNRKGYGTESIEYVWDGECGPSDSKTFRIKVSPATNKDASCLPYHLYVSMRKK